MYQTSKKRIYTFIALSSLLLAGCSTTGQETSSDTDSSANSSSKQEMKVVLTAEMGSADLSLATDSNSFTTLNNAYEGLYRLNEKNEPEIAGASEEATVSEDGLTYTVKLREDAKWSNGDLVTAKDYVFSWQRTVAPETASGYAYMLEPVKNASAISEGELDKEELGVKAVGDYELEITLEQPTPYFTSLLAFPTFFPQNQKAVDEFGDQYALTSDNAYYNGPFVLTDFDGPGTDVDWTLQKNEEYWDAENVELETVEFDVVKESSTALNLFESGDANEISLTGELAKQKSDDENAIKQLQGMTQYLELNQDGDSVFKNLNLRKAISSALDRKQIVDNILGDGSVVATGIVPQDMSFNPDTKADFTEEAGTDFLADEEKAQEYWENAKQELDIDELSFELLTSDTESSKKMAEYVQGTLQKTLPGMTVSVSNVPLSVRLDRSNSGDFEVVMNNWVADYADPINFLELFTSDSSYNRGKWVNEEFDQWIDASKTTDVSDPTKRFQDMVEAEKVLSDDLGVIPLYQGANVLMRTPDVQGLVTHGVGAGYDFKGASIK
ncbi:MAG TPA: peptide ABC transporter substrate-binding protein [Candidatus Tetragenococcus pullicola]|nr:peptide ABC transporter substrate-binding protein [Candidatus Tetragenococcus pullicola]